MLKFRRVKYGAKYWHLIFITIPIVLNQISLFDLQFYQHNIGQKCDWNQNNSCVDDQISIHSLNTQIVRTNSTVDEALQARHASNFGKCC